MLRSWMISFVVSLFLCASAGATPAQNMLKRSAARGPNTGALEAALSISQFQTTALFDRDGNKVPLVDDEDFQMIDSELELRYGYGPKLEFSGALRLRSTEATSNGENYSGQGLESGMVGLKWSFLTTSAWKMAISGRARTTFYSNETYASAADAPVGEQALGDSGTTFQIGGHLSYEPSQSSFMLNSSLFYQRSPKTISDEIHYRLEGVIPFQKLLLAGGVEGVFSMNQDGFSEVPDQKPVLAGAVTSLFNSIDRSYMQPFVRVGYGFENLAIEGLFARVMSGVSTDEGNLLGARVSWAFGAGKNASQMRVERFKEYFVEASVLRVSPRAKFLKIDKGMASDVRKGMQMDIFQTDFFGGNVLVASGVVFEVAADSAIIRLEKRFSDREIKPGFTARGR